MNIQWYPGHMTKAKRMMQENIKLIDVVIEILDARVPQSSQNPEINQLANNKPRIMVLNKVDLAERLETQKWANHFRKQGFVVVEVNAKNGQGIKRIGEAVKEACKEKIARNKRRGLINKPMRAMVVGIPNVGKSTFINKLVGRTSAKVGNKPGVTKGKQWLKLKKEIELLDTPGVLWPKFESKEVGIRLAMIGSIKEEILDTESLAVLVLEFLRDTYPDYLEKKFHLEVDQAKDGVWLLSELAVKANYKLKGNVPDVSRMALVILDKFKNGQMGQVTLEKVKVE